MVYFFKGFVHYSRTEKIYTDMKYSFIAFIFLTEHFIWPCNCQNNNKCNIGTLQELVIRNIRSENYKKNRFPEIPTIIRTHFEIHEVTKVNELHRQITFFTALTQLVSST